MLLFVSMVSVYSILYLEYCKFHELLNQVGMGKEKCRRQHCEMEFLGNLKIGLGFFDSGW